MVRRVLVVDCSEDAQIARAMARTGLDEQTVRGHHGCAAVAQGAATQADDVIFQRCGYVSSETAGGAMHKKYLALANQS